MFSPLATTHWVPPRLGAAAPGECLVAVDPALAPRRSVSRLRLEGGPTVLTLSPDRARALELADGDRLPDEEAARRLDRAGVALHDPDLLFHLPVAEQDVLREEPWGEGARELTAEDSAAFRAFTAAAPADELDEAFVELDHWLVVGTVEGDALVSITSMYPWGESRLADLGVITLPTARGRGLGRRTVRAISAAALARGYEPLYRCQLGNHASAALARSAGFALFGHWEGLRSEE